MTQRMWVRVPHGLYGIENSCVIQVLSLESALSDFETQCEGKILALNYKLQNVESSAQEARSSWWQKKEVP